MLAPFLRHWKVAGRIPDTVTLRVAEPSGLSVTLNGCESKRMALGSDVRCAEVVPPSQVRPESPSESNMSSPGVAAGAFHAQFVPALTAL